MTKPKQMISAEEIMNKEGYHFQEFYLHHYNPVDGQWELCTPGDLFNKSKNPEFKITRKPEFTKLIKTIKPFE